ncbi:MAG: LemA family protein [Rhodospirillaceae bacterium]|nr:LemA family protein [Rhodospirillaceae bacterium]
MTTTIIIAVAVVLGLYVAATYNKLIGLRNRVQEAWSDIDVQMKRRYDLIPTLVETVKGYASHEKQTLESVINARNVALADKGSPAHQAQSEGLLGGALKNLFALAESYPDLKANTNFLDLQRQLSEVEGTIEKARRYYNGSARDMNNAVQQFPSNLIARPFGFSTAEFFEIDAAQSAAREPVPVKF